jgi:DNA processing protein
MLNITNRQALLGFSYFAKIGPTKMNLLEKLFSEARFAFLASYASLEKAGLKPKLISDFIAWRENFDITLVEEELKKEGLGFITWHEENYPSLLKEISDPPYLLYYRGEQTILNDKQKKRLAIVGPREHDLFAKRIINDFLPNIISQQIETISGLALGVDTLAHQKTLTERGITLAVLGSGLDWPSIYPRENKILAQKIISSNGLLISEFPPKTKPLKQNFPRRNRIISGLAQATLIMEAKEKSGALITAFYALEQNREVLAVPGDIYNPFSLGTNKLIKMGAKVVTAPGDILEIFSA